MPKHTTIFAIISITSALFFLPASTIVRAQENTNAQETASESGSLVSEELTKRIQKVLVEKREQVKGALDSLIGEKRATIGKITRITDEALTIQYQDNTTIVPLSKTVLLLKNDKEIKVSEVVVENWITVLGTKDKTTIDPEYLIVSTKSLLPQKQLVVLGNITKLEKNSVTLQPRDGTAPQTILFSKNVTVLSSDGEAAKVSDLTTDLTVLITGSMSEEKLEASTIKSLAPLK
jgi:hypothetical protein